MSLSEHLSRLATSDPVEHVTHVQYRSIMAEQIGATTWHDMPDPRTCSVTFDETTRPYGHATLTWATNDWDHWDYFDPTNSEERPRLRISTGYHWPRTGEEAVEQLALVIATELAEDDDGTITVTADSDECLLENDYVRPDLTWAVPDTATDIADIWDAARTTCQALWNVRITQRDPIPTANLGGVRALELTTGTKFAEWLWTLADTAGLWLHSDQSPTSTGGLVAITRPDIKTPLLDLSKASPHPLVLRRRRVRSLDDYASTVDLTVHWTEADDDHQLSQRFTTTNTMPHVVTRDLDLRPPLVDSQRALPPYWTPGVDLVERMSKRGLVESFDARSCYWLRPRDTVRTDSGRLLISSISYDTSTGLMTLSARPY